MVSSAPLILLRAISAIIFMKCSTVTIWSFTDVIQAMNLSMKKINRTIRTLLILIGFVIAIWLAFAWFGQSDIVTSRYETIKSAKDEGVMARGWLPDILPDSSFAIRTSNNLDLNSSNGEFSFNRNDYSQFSKLCDSYRQGITSTNIHEKVNATQMKDYEVLVYKESRAEWIFFCNKNDGFCEYTMKLSA